MSLPGLSSSGSGVVVSVSFAQTTRFLACSGEATSFTMLVNSVGDPADSRITTDGLVARIDKDDFEVLVGRVLVDPVGVEDAEVGAAATNSFFSGGTERALILELVHSLVGGLAISSTLWHRLLATTTAHTNSVNDVTLFGLVPETASLVWSRWTRSAVDDVQLSELPAANSEKKSKDIGLLLLLKFLDVLEGTHLDCCAL